MSNSFPQSFVDFDKMKKVETLEEFHQIINDSVYQTNYEDGVRRGHLENLDLSELDLSKGIWNFDGWYIHNVAFSRLRPDSKERKSIFGLSFVGSYLQQVSFAQSELIRCNFDKKDFGAFSINAAKICFSHSTREWEKANGDIQSPQIIQSDVLEFDDYYNEIWQPSPGSPSKLEEVDFFLSELNMCRFRNTFVMAVDFRYSHIKDCSMSESKFFGSDFYFCSFENATNFIDSKFIRCSFTNTIFENNCVRLQNIPNGILQENYKAYTHIITNYPKWIRLNPCYNFSSLNHAENKGDEWESRMFLCNETTEFYKQLSGIYAGKGLNRDSNRAYKKAKQNEIYYHFLGVLLSFKKGKIISSFKHLGKCFMNLITAMFGYGYQWQAAVFWFVVLISVYGYMYYNNSQDGLERAMSYSFNNSLGPYDKLADIVGFFIASCQTALGMLLIGFLGFIIANNLRNDS